MLFLTVKELSVLPSWRASGETGSLLLELRRIDRDDEARRRGRSAFVRSAVLACLETKRRKQIDDQIRKVFAGKASTLASEFDGLIAGQAWPKD